MFDKFEKEVDELYVEALENLVDKQLKLIESQAKEIELSHELITKLCRLCGIEPPKWEG